MWKQLTGEPVAGKLHTGFGGRGRRSPFPTPIPSAIADVRRSALGWPFDDRDRPFKCSRVAQNTDALGTYNPTTPAAQALVEVYMAGADHIYSWTSRARPYSQMAIRVGPVTVRRECTHRSRSSMIELQREANGDEGRCPHQLPTNTSNIV